MIESCQSLRTGEPAVELSGNTFLVDAALIGELLGLPAARVPALMRDGQITSACERGTAEHDGQFRLTFFYHGRRARLSTDPAGRILRRSVIDVAKRPVQEAMYPTGA